MGMVEVIANGFELQRMAIGMSRQLIIERLGRPIRRYDLGNLLTWQFRQSVLTVHFAEGIADGADASVAWDDVQPMKVHPGHMDGFGCAKCMANPLEPQHGVGRGVLVGQRDLIDDSHFIASLCRCRHCNQDFLYIFTEMIDWEDGDDDQDWLYVPLTVAEAAVLQPMEEADLERAINNLNMRRHHIHVSHPTRSPCQVRWQDSWVRVRMHD